MRKYILLGLAVAVVALLGSASAARADIVQSTTWNCTSAQSGTNVTVNFPASGNGVMLKAGCTGYINSITVYLTRGDGIHVGNADHLEIGSIHIYGFGHDVGAHQDGVQNLSGTNITFDGGYVGCYSCNNSQMMMHPATGSVGPQYTLVKNVQADPAGVNDPTLSGCSPGDPGVCGSVATALGTVIPAHGQYYWGAGGSYGLSNGLSDHSGYQCVDLLSRSNNHDLWQDTTGQVTNQVWSFNTTPGLPSGVTDNFGEAWTYCDNTPPTAPTSLTLTDGSQASQVGIAYGGSTDNVGVAGYHVSLDGIQQTDNETTVTGLTWGTHTISVTAFDAAGNVSTPITKTITSAWN